VRLAVISVVIGLVACTPVTTETDVQGIQCIGIYVNLKVKRATNKQETEDPVCKNVEVQDE